MHQTTMVLFVLCSTFLLTLPDNATAADKFFQSGGRYGKRHDERISGKYHEICIALFKIISIIIGHKQHRLGIIVTKQIECDHKSYTGTFESITTRNKKKKKQN